MLTGLEMRQRKKLKNFIQGFVKVYISCSSSSFECTENLEIEIIINPFKSFNSKEQATKLLDDALSFGKFSIIKDKIYCQKCMQTGTHEETEE